MPALPFGKLRLTAKKPLNSSYPKNLDTLGDHIRSKRLDLNLHQKDVARALGVDGSSILNWEINKTAPDIRLIPRIHGFLGYCPILPGKDRSLSQIIKAWREGLGMSQEEIARAAGVDESALADWEAGRAKPIRRSREKIERFFLGARGSRAY